ncbi:hypothetical protein EJ04DRAFT_582378 [Polyplosphaeria fusca]|uniref:F-box domain-containing protein n=1 Tax=Polyplosphaeria fusca TaxID=682080 RepID=A0A9P4QIK1_9PLEO|nr:hypothetical protein EJ04DRAFT_582378 [Polyplosphaeria fusca]
MAAFADLPTELVEQIVSYCHDQNALHSLTCTSKLLYSVTLPFLYRHVDLRVSPRGIPRVDSLFFEIRKKPELANTIQSLRLGFTPDLKEDMTPNLKRLPIPSSETRQKQLVQQSNQDPFDKLHYEPFLRDAIENRGYGPFATILVLALPTLRYLDVATCDQFDQYHSSLSLKSLTHSVLSKPAHLFGDNDFPACASIQEVSHNFDRTSGVRYARKAWHDNIQPFFRLPGVQKVELVIPNNGIFNPMRRHIMHTPREPGVLQNVTNLVLRHSSRAFHDLANILAHTPQLSSLTCEMWQDHSLLPQDDQGYLTEALALRSCLEMVRTTLKTLAVSVEYCNTSKPYYQQPNILQTIRGDWSVLDLASFKKLENLELPFPFVTGDLRFFVAGAFEPCLPPNLRHLCLRQDMSQAQFIYPLELSNRLDSTFAEMKKCEQWKNNSRMDLAYMFQTTLSLLDRANGLESISVWQPAEPSLEWFDGQLQDFATTCKNKGVTGKVLYPQILRRKGAEHWNLIREKTVFDTAYPAHCPYDQLVRGENQHGIPLGLGCQYHMAKVQVYDVPL